MLFRKKRKSVEKGTFECSKCHSKTQPYKKEINKDGETEYYCNCSNCGYSFKVVICNKPLDKKTFLEMFKQSFPEEMTNEEILEAYEKFFGKKLE